MKILESSPDRYEWGIRILTFGKLDKAYDHLVSYIEKDNRVLDIGCGTGALMLRAAERGAKVKGIDINPLMLEIAEKRAIDAALTGKIELFEMGVAELANEKPGSYDIVMSGLCFSELTEDELSDTLKEVKRILKPGGLLLIADEQQPAGIAKRTINRLIRVPLSIITYLITQTTTKAIKDLPQKIKEAGLTVESVRLNMMENFIELTGRKPEIRVK